MIPSCRSMLEVVDRVGLSAVELACAQTALLSLAPVKLGDCGGGESDASDGASEPQLLTLLGGEESMAAERDGLVDD